MVLQSEKGFSLTKSDRNQLWDLWVDGAWKMWGGGGGGVIWCEFMEIHTQRVVKV